MEHQRITRKYRGDRFGSGRRGANPMREFALRARRVKHAGPALTAGPFGNGGPKPGARALGASVRPSSIPWTSARVNLGCERIAGLPSGGVWAGDCCGIPVLHQGFALRARGGWPAVALERGRSFERGVLELGARILGAERLGRWRGSAVFRVAVGPSFTRLVAVPTLGYAPQARSPKIPRRGAVLWERPPSPTIRETVSELGGPGVDPLPP